MISSLALCDWYCSEVTRRSDLRRPACLGCWRDRLALTSVAVADRMLGRDEDETAIRHGVLLTAAGDDQEQAENGFWLRG